MTTTSVRAASAAIGILLSACATDGSPDDLDGVDQSVDGTTTGTANVLINEVLAGSSGRIELWNAGTAPQSLAGWRVDDIADGGYAPKALTGTLAPGALLVVTYAGVNTASADSVRLVDDAGVERDAHANGYTGTSIANLCFGRAYDGGPWETAARTCSIGASNGAPPPPPSTDIELVQMPRRDKVLLQGTVVLPDRVFRGGVLVEGDTITCVGESCGALDAAIVNTNGLIMPGLIDAHNHILFDIFDEQDWVPSKLYSNHNQWPNEARYKAMVDAKQYLNGEAGSPMSLGCELNKYGEMKALIAGTTSVQGSANPSDRACYRSVARSIDQASNGLSADVMQTATIFPTASSANSVCANFDSGRTRAYVIHIGEGIDTTSRNELTKLGTVTTTPQCLYAAQTAIVHGTALGDADMQLLADHGMSLVWSPRSNMFLYGQTTNIPLARAKGINVALAPDWSIGGSQNMLDELRFADRVDNTQWGNVLSAQDLFKMATVNAARALGVDDVLGEIAVGKKADLMVIPGDATDPYGALLRAHPSDVRLVMVGGTALYGDLAVAPLAPPAPAYETLDICGAQKFASVAQANGTASDKLGQTFAEIQSTLTQGLTAYDAMDKSAWDFAPLAPLTTCSN